MSSALLNQQYILSKVGFPDGSADLPANAETSGDAGLILGSGKSPGGGNGNPLWYSCLEYPTDRGA